MSQSPLPDTEPSITETTPFSFRLALIWRQIELFSRYLKFHWRVTAPASLTPQGFKFYGNRHVVAGNFEPHETAVFSKVIQRVDGFVNVGANVGYYCCLALAAGKPVIAFEPVDLNVRHLLANVRINGWEDRFELLPVCLGDRSGVVSLYGGGTGASLLRGWANSPDSHANLAPINTADNLLQSRLVGTRQLFLVDIEGAEALFLEGAQKQLSATPQHFWIIEISIATHRADSINLKLKSIFSRFLELGYEARAIKKEGLQKVDMALIEVVMEQQKNLLGANNFLFVPRGEVIEI